MVKPCTIPCYNAIVYISHAQLVVEEMVRGSAWCVGTGRLLRRLRAYAGDKMSRAANYVMRTPPDMRFVPFLPF